MYQRQIIEYIVLASWDWDWDWDWTKSNKASLI